MSSDLHDQASRLFLQALELLPKERGEFLDRECGPHKELRAAVEHLLEHHQEDDFLAPPESPAHPTHVASYRIRGVLGQGGMGIVYEAEQSRPHRTVALKVIPVALLSSRARRRFEHEAEILGQLQHPGIAQIYEAGTASTDTGSQPFFAMELVRGLSLISFADAKVLNIRQRLELFIKICDAVQHAHQRGVIHRDLKPANVLVDENDCPKILDFGIARSTDADTQSASLQTAMGEIMGTLAYMSPEQTKGDPDAIDTRTDVYALGALLHELLSGQPMFEPHHTSLPAALERIRHHSPPRLGTLDNELRGDLETIVTKATAKEKERRYPSAASLAEDVLRHLRDEPIAARPPSSSYQLRKFALRNKVLVAGVSATFLALAFGLLATLNFFWQAQENAAVAKESEQRALSLADLQRLDELKEGADGLWPRRPDQVDAMTTWLDRSVSLTERLPDHQDSLTMIRQEGLEGADGAWEFPDFETRWLHDSFLKLVKGIARFASDDPAHGIIVQVQDRLQFARTIRELTIGAYEEQWKDAIAEILLDDRYGFELEPLIGLVPLGTDPESGLWEFWHLESGERPQRDPETGRYRVSDKTGIVLVLIPQGDFIMGAEGTREEWDLAPHLARGYEFPQHRVQLDPFFLSKYEMTVGQWARIDGPNRMRAWTGQSVQQAHPIGTIAWLEADLYVHRFGLRLPTDAQWEYACRAGTQSLFWTGDSLSDLASAENLADRSYGREIANVIFEPWNDGAPFPSLVGSFRPNSFGLFDMAGNIGEWCRDWLVSFSTEPRPGDGERWPSAETPSDRTVRGGTFSKPATDARSSSRWGNAPDATIDYLGVRPSLSIHGLD